MKRRKTLAVAIAGLLAVVTAYPFLAGGRGAPPVQPAGAGQGRIDLTKELAPLVDPFKKAHGLK